MKFKPLIFLLAGSLIVSGCYKYQEGPLFSFLSKKKRLTRVWHLDALFINSVETSFTGTARWDFREDGTYLVYQNDSLKNQGHWEFSSDKEEVTLEYTNSSGQTATDEWYITKLSSKNFWVKEFTNGTTFGYYMISGN